MILNSLDRTAKAILVALIDGRELTLLAGKLRRSRSALQDRKQRLGQLIREHLGEDILKQVLLEPSWTNTLHAIREPFACRAERRTGVEEQEKGRASFCFNVRSARPIFNGP